MGYFSGLGRWENENKQIIQIVLSERDEFG